MRSGRFVKKRVYRTVVSVAFIKMAEGELPMAILPLVYRFLGKLNDNRRSNLRSRHCNCHDRDLNHNRNYGGGEVPLPWHRVRA